jgi:hypothetical protein
MPTSTALEIVPQAREGRHEGVVLHALALLPPQSPSARHGLLLLPCAYDALSSAVSSLHCWRLVRGAPQDGCDRRMRPASMLSHRRRDGNTFCDHERYRVDCDGDRSGIEARDCFVECGRDIVVAAGARHGARKIVVGMGMRLRGGRATRCPQRGRHMYNYILVQLTRKMTRILLIAAA